jgi:hypothetical protein
VAVKPQNVAGSLMSVSDYALPLKARREVWPLS